MPRIDAALLTPFTLDEPEWVTRILGTWERVAPELLPEFADYRDPPRKPLNLPLTDDDLNRLRGYWYGRRVKPHLKSRCQSATYWHGEVSLGVSHATPGKILPSVVRWTDAFAEQLATDYGFVHVLTKAELAEEDRMDIWRPRLDGSDVGAGIVGSGTNFLKYGIPTLYWRMYFGPAYVGLFGAGTIEQAPVCIVESHPWGYVLQLTERPPDDKSWAEFVSVRERTIDWLGRDAFRTRPKATPARVPSSFFDFHARAIDGQTSSGLGGGDSRG